MKKQIRLTLLFVLAITLFLGVLAAIPFSAFADEDTEYKLTVRVVIEDGTLIQDYGQIKKTGGATSTESVIEYPAPAGATISLTVTNLSGNYEFVGWMYDLQIGETIGRGSNGEILTIEKLNSNITRYAVFKPTEYKIYYVGSRSGQDKIPEAVKALYVIDEQDRPEYNSIRTPEKHTYGTPTKLPVTANTRANDEPQTHVFLRWKAYDEEGGVIPLDENGAISAGTNSDIYLIPEWEPLQFLVTRIDRFGTPDEYEETEYSHEELVNYGAPVSGKDFGGVTEYIGYWFNDSDETLYTQVEHVGTDGAVIYRYYTPCKYDITFDVNAPVADAVTVRGTEKLKDVIYKKAMPAEITVPQCTGYQFLGYYYVTEENEVRYYDADGKLDEQITVWEIPSNVTLIAKWEIQKHSVVIHVLGQNGKDCSDAVKILINGKETFEPMDYGTQGYVRVTILSGQNLKITKWNGEVVPHTDSATVPFLIEEKDIEITVQLLPAEETPALKEDYESETLSGFSSGTYRIEADGIPVMELKVAGDGKIEMTGGTRSESLSISDLFGKTLTIIRPGVSDWTADSDVQELKLQARPAAVPEGSVVCTITETKQMRELAFQAKDDSGVVYEIAYTTSEYDIPEEWTTDLTLTGLETGTSYTVWMRVRATETAPHGEMVQVLKNHEFSYLIDLKPLFLILLFVLILQGVALAFLLISRNRARMNAVSAPLAVLVAMKFVPGAMLPWVIILTIAVVAMQAVLIYLALKTKVVFRKKEKNAEASGEDGKTNSEDFTLFGEERSPSDRTDEADRNQNQND